MNRFFEATNRYVQRPIEILVRENPFSFNFWLNNFDWEDDKSWSAEDFRFWLYNRLCNLEILKR